MTKYVRYAGVPSAFTVILCGLLSATSRWFQIKGSFLKDGHVVLLRLSEFMYFKQIVSVRQSDCRLQTLCTSLLFGWCLPLRSEFEITLHHNERNVLYCSQDIIRVMRSRRMRWAEYVERMGKRRGAYMVLVRKPQVKRPLERPRCRWEDNIKKNL